MCRLKPGLATGTAALHGAGSLPCALRLSPPRQDQSKQHLEHRSHLSFTTFDARDRDSDALKCLYRVK